jgi:hypothetical protein
MEVVRFEVGIERTALEEALKRQQTFLVGEHLYRALERDNPR